LLWGEAEINLNAVDFVDAGGERFLDRLKTVLPTYDLKGMFLVKLSCELGDDVAETTAVLRILLHSEERGVVSNNVAIGAVLRLVLRIERYIGGRQGNQPLRPDMALRVDRERPRINEKVKDIPALTWFKRIDEF